MYIELKTGFADNGPAWIGYVITSKSGKSMYFNGRALRKISRGRYADVETKEVYWVSGVKKNGADRHWAGRGKVLVEARAVDEYLAIIGERKLAPSKYGVFEARTDIDTSKFHRLSNEKLGNDLDDLLASLDASDG
jgi:hypothetical protein